MSLTQVYTAVPNDVITAARWNNEFGNIYNNLTTEVQNTQTTATGGITPRTFQAHHAVTLNAKDFGCVGDGVTDDYTAMQAAWTYVASNNMTLYIPPGTYLLSNLINISGLTTSEDGFRITGAGKHLTVFKRNHNNGSGTIQIGDVDNFVLEHFTVNGNHALQTNGSHGIAYYNASNSRISDLYIHNFYNSGIIAYSSVEGASAYADNLVERCTVDGLGAGLIGIMHADYLRSIFRDCVVRNIDTAGNPGYAIQFKNNCRDCSMHNITVDTARAGIVVTHDGNVYTDGSGTRVTNAFVYNTAIAGLYIAATKYGVYQGILIDMNNQGTEPVVFDDTTPNFANGNTVSCNIMNIAAGKGAARFKTPNVDNVVRIGTISNVILGTWGNGNAGQFDSGSLRNQIILDRVAVPTNVASTTTFHTNNGGPTNLFVYNEFPLKQAATIATGVIAVRDNRIQHIRVDTELAAASDDLDTITAGVDCQVVTLSTTNSGRDVVVKHNTGNILVNGAADFTLTNTADTISLRYDSTLTKWCEVGRGDNS